MDDPEIRLWVAAIDSKDSVARDAAWERLRGLEERLLPFLQEFFPRARRFEARRDIAFQCIRYARDSEIAFEIGLAAIRDKSAVVRYRGCCILAYSLRVEAVPPLRVLEKHADARTVADARAAIDAIVHRNHHYFIDRGHSGQSFWEVRPGDLP
jgi:hypothetical protein